MGTADNASASDRAPACGERGRNGYHLFNFSQVTGMCRLSASSTFFCKRVFHALRMDPVGSGPIERVDALRRNSR